MTTLANNIWRCKYCDRKMDVSDTAYAENPFCNGCLSERLAKAAAERGPVINMKLPNGFMESVSAQDVIDLRQQLAAANARIATDAETIREAGETLLSMTRKIDALRTDLARVTAERNDVARRYDELVQCLMTACKDPPASAPAASGPCRHYVVNGGGACWCNLEDGHGGSHEFDCDATGKEVKRVGRASEKPAAPVAVGGEVRAKPMTLKDFILSRSPGPFKPGVIHVSEGTVLNVYWDDAPAYTARVSEQLDVHRCSDTDRVVGVRLWISAILADAVASDERVTRLVEACRAVHSDLHDYRYGSATLLTDARTDKLMDRLMAAVAPFANHGTAVNPHRTGAFRNRYLQSDAAAAIRSLTGKQQRLPISQQA